MGLTNFRAIDFGQNSDAMKRSSSKRDRVSSLSEPVPTTSPVTGDDPNSVPTGTVPEIMTWVGEDLERAQAALDREVDDDKPRKGLVTQLQEMIDAADESDGSDADDSDPDEK